MRFSRLAALIVMTAPLGAGASAIAASSAPAEAVPSLAASSTVEPQSADPDTGSDRLSDPAPTLQPDVEGTGSSEESGVPMSTFVTPPPTVQWDAIAQGAALVRPPDDSIAAGTGTGALGRIVEVTNGWVQIFNKNGAAITVPTSLSTMFPPLPGSFVFDPKVLFDQASGRFFIVVLELDYSGAVCTSALLSSRIRIAVSTTAVPNNLTTNWISMAGPGLIVIGGTTTWSDYPSLGADSDSLFVTTNQFSAPCTYTGSNIRVFDKAMLLGGVYSFVDIPFSPVTTPGLGPIQPAHVFGATDNGGFYLINRADPVTYRIYNIMGDPGAPVATTALFPWVAGAFPGDTTADQCALALPDLDTISTNSRAMNAVYRDGALWVAQTANFDADGQTEVVWHQITTNSYPAGVPVVTQSGFIQGVGTVDPWTFMPSINVNSAGDAVINYSQSSGTQCPSIYAAMRLNADPLGTLQAPVLVRASGGFYDSSTAGPTERWGDYSAVAVDPTNQCLWLSNEYAATSAVGTSLWGTHIADICTASEGACCFGTNTCGMRKPADCAAQGGNFRGLGSKCPTQNVLSAMHASGSVVHWVGSAVNCLNITPLVGGGSNCCVAHPNPGCDNPSCEANVCGFDSFCCDFEWDPQCVSEAQNLCGVLCSQGCNPSFSVDPWVTSTAPGQNTCHSFGNAETPPIPYGFFYPGSDPFTGTICYFGQPLGGQFDPADTLVRRFGDPFDRCDIPGPQPHSVPIEIVALNLQSVSPIQVTGSQHTQWNVHLDLSPNFPSPSGTLTATKTHCNGGTWSSFLPVQARMTFTNVQNPSDIRVLDTGEMGFPPINLNLGNSPWVTTVDPNLHLPGAECTNFHPGIQDPGQTTSCDCNHNNRKDECDIESGFSGDCNGNGVPDECDTDSDFDQVPNDCDNCPGVFNPLQEDSDSDLIGNACDLCPFLARRLEGDHDGDEVFELPDVVLPVGDNCPCVANRGQEDANHDGIGDACEATTAGRVPPTLHVTRSGGNLTLTWSASCLSTDDDYAVYEGTIGGTFTSHLPRACSTLSATTMTFATPSGNKYYLVVPQSGGLIEGSYGQKTSGERPPSASACKPQSLGACP